MMKPFALLISLTMALSAKAQVDSLEFSTRRKIADTLFGQLDPGKCDSVLFERSMSGCTLLTAQFLNVPKPIATAWDWLQAYSDLAICYWDSTKLLSDEQLSDEIDFFFENAETSSESDELILPFGIFIHELSIIDSNVCKPANSFSNVGGQLVLNPAVSEDSIYRKLIVSGAAVLELYSQHGYDEGTVIYYPDFVTVSPNISLLSVHLDLGSGFQFFDTAHPAHYFIHSNWQTAKAAVSYSKEGQVYNDTLDFYLTGKLYEFHEKTKSNSWDTESSAYKYMGDKVLKYRIKFGCGTGVSLRRPFIIAPPYRPSSQGVSFSTYYDQFNFAGMFDHLSDMGYDIIFIKETPGNKGVDYAGTYLAEFLKYINTRKHEGYPDEDWENIVMGFSAGGQHWRYALKKLEKEHMEWGNPHHHTRLYIPFDSPHWGANVPMFTQAVLKDMVDFSIMAFLTYNSLTDAASKHMLMNHIKGSVIVESGHDRTIHPYPTTEKANLDASLKDDFNHQFTPLNDLRRSFPTFTRNVAVTMGSNSSDYNTNYSLYPEMKLFEQNTAEPTWYGGNHFKRKLFSSKYGSNPHVFDRDDLFLFFGVPIHIRRYYRTFNAYEWDIAQGGYKDEFYDKGGMQWFDLGSQGVPVAPINILIASAQTLPGIYTPNAFGVKYYEGHISFLPTLSSLGINPAIWNNNQLYYNLKDEGLMFNQFDIQNNPPSDLYGYPNLGHSNDHFLITPFEAIYCDPQTYEHIKLDASVAQDQLDDDYLWYTRYFIQDEVEATDVCLQNKVIGDNHIQWQPYRYKAWYKSSDNIFVGESVTPKTDPGPYVIKPTGDITLYACNHVNFKPGFSVQAGGTLHAYIKCDGCNPSYDKSGNSSGDTDKSGSRETGPENSQKSDSRLQEQQDQLLQVFPNPSSGKISVLFPCTSGAYSVIDNFGRYIQAETKVISSKLYLELPKGLYHLRWSFDGQVITTKIVVL